MEGGSGDVVVGVNYRRDNGKRQAEWDSDAKKEFQSCQVKMMDARLRQEMTLHKNGFELRAQRTGMTRGDYFNNDYVKEQYYPLCEEAIKQATGAVGVKCFHHLVRGHTSGKPFAGAAHCDYSTRTAYKLSTNVKPDGIAMPFKGRICVLNLWRNINEAGPIQNHHLAMCDGSTVVSPDDFVHYDVIDDASGEVSETFQMSPNNHRLHSWFYYPNMAADEVLIFMQYDSDPANRCRYTFHSSVSVHDDTIKYQRESIEVRCVAFFPDENNNTLPDLTMPVEMRVPAACNSIKEMTCHLQHWDAEGKRFAAVHVRSNQFEKFVRGNCRHHRNEQLRPEFKDLTDDDIDTVSVMLATDAAWTSELAALVEEVCEAAPTTQRDRVQSASDKVMDDVRHIQHWDSGGKTWLKGCVAGNKLGEVAHGLCNHHKKEQLAPFTDLTDAEVGDVAAECLKRGLANVLKEKASNIT